MESESNLSFEPGDDAWIFDDAICAGDGYVDKGSRLFGNAVVCGRGYVSHDSAMSAHTRVEDDAYIRGADLCGHARVSGRGMVLASSDSDHRPILSENCAVYGTVQGDIHMMGTAVVIDGEEIYNNTLDTLVINGQGRSIIRDRPGMNWRLDSRSPGRPRRKWGGWNDEQLFLSRSFGHCLRMAP